MNALLRPPPAAGVTTTDRWLAATLLIAGLILRVVYIWHFRIDSDEPQHLHVVWAWANGMLPYRDVFDNHAPVFQALSAPLFHLLGVRPDILFPMRFAMLPIYALTIFCVWKIAALLFTPRTALWTAVLAAYYPTFFFSSIEYRPDQLWALVWLVILAVLVMGRVTPRRAAVVGLLLGLAFSISMKSTLYFLTLAFALGGALLVRRKLGGPALDRGMLLRCIGAGLVGVVIVPAIVVLFFVLRGVGHDMYYCVIAHNILPQPRRVGPLLRATMYWLLSMPIAIAGCWIIMRSPRPAAVRTRTAFIYLAGVLFYQTLVCFWPILTAEDYLPFFPAMAITAAPAVLWIASRVSEWSRVPFAILAGLCVAGELAYIVTEPHRGDQSGATSPLVDQTADKISIIANTLKLTEPTDFIMDAKGETIYRKRSFYFVLEALSIRRLQMGLMKDDIIQSLIDTRAPLLSSRRMTVRAHEFVRANYLPIAFRLRVLGQLFRESDQKAGSPCSIEVTIPARYTLLTPWGTPTGTLDGTPFTGPRELAAGHHEFVRTGKVETLALVWATALERGYSPFALIKHDYTTPQD